MTAAATKAQLGDQVVFELLADFDLGGLNISASYGFSSPAFNDFTVRAYGGVNITFMYYFPSASFLFTLLLLSNSFIAVVTQGQR